MISTHGVNPFHYHEAGNFVVNDFEGDENIDDVLIMRMRIMNDEEVTKQKACRPMLTSIKALYR